MARTKTEKKVEVIASGEVKLPKKKAVDKKLDISENMELAVEEPKEDVNVETVKDEVVDLSNNDSHEELNKKDVTEKVKEVAKPKKVDMRLFGYTWNGQEYDF